MTSPQIAKMLVLVMAIILILAAIIFSQRLAPWALRFLLILALASVLLVVLRHNGLLGA